MNTNFRALGAELRISEKVGDMVYLRNVFIRTSICATIAMLAVVLDLTLDVDAGTMKIAYKKGIFGKANVVKEKRYNIRSGVIRQMPTITSRPDPTITNMNSNTETSISTGPLMSPSSNISGPAGTTAMMSLGTTIPSPIQVLAPTEEISIDDPTAPMPAAIDHNEMHKLIASHTSDRVETEANIHPQDIEKEPEDKPLAVEEDEALQQYFELNRLIARSPEIADVLPHVQPLLNNTLEETAQESLRSEIFTDAEAPKNIKTERKDDDDDEIEELFPLPEPEALIAPRRVITPTKASSKKNLKTTTTESNRPVPCTCGVFLTSQFKRGQQPQGAPAVTNELDRTFPCTAVGQKQCQTKCLETLVQHLPNSATILCASLNRDCRKERAYLFIKNCRNYWVNTNLTAGREYCCRDGKPYNCPLV